MWLQLLTMAGGVGYSIRKPFHIRLKHCFQLNVKIVADKFRFKKGVGHSPYLFFSIQKLCPALFSTKTHFMKDCDYVSNSEFSFLKLARKLSFLCWNKHLNSTFFLGMQTYTRPQGFLISKNMIVIFDCQSLTIVKKRSRKSFSLHNL